MAQDQPLWAALGFQLDQTYQAEEIIAQVRAHPALGLATGPQAIDEDVVALTLLHRRDNALAGRLYFKRAGGTAYRVHRPSQV